MIRFIIPLICFALFFMEPVFGLLSPLEFDGDYYYIVPRFLLMFLIFLSVFYDRKRAMMLGLFFGLLYDVFYIDIIGLYSFLYPAMCLIAGTAAKNLYQNLPVATFLTIVLTALFEFILYLFFSLISLISMPLGTFFDARLVPTMIANSVFLVMLGWAFKYIIIARLNERGNRTGLL